MVALMKGLKEFEESIERQLFHNFIRINSAVTGNVAMAEAKMSTGGPIA